MPCRRSPRGLAIASSARPPPCPPSAPHPPSPLPPQVPRVSKVPRRVREGGRPLQHGPQVRPRLCKFFCKKEPGSAFLNPIRAIFHATYSVWVPRVPGLPWEVAQGGRREGLSQGSPEGAARTLPLKLLVSVNGREPARAPSLPLLSGGVLGPVIRPHSGLPFHYLQHWEETDSRRGQGPAPPRFGRAVHGSHSACSQGGNSLP